MVPPNVVDILGNVVQEAGDFLMRVGFLAGMIDRARANAGGVKAAPEAFAVLAIIAFAIPYFAVRQSYGERLAVVETRLVAQETLLADYRDKLRGASQAAGRIEKLSALATDLQKQLNDQKRKVVVAADNRGRDPQRLYAHDSPVALVRDPQVDLAQKKVTFPAVTSETLLAMDRPYEYQNWKLWCGGTQSYSALDDGAAPEFLYSHLTCRIVGDR
jgi:hypothetical protein